jgi:hypothetical protein
VKLTKRLQTYHWGKINIESLSKGCREQHQAISEEVYPPLYEDMISMEDKVLAAIGFLITMFKMEVPSLILVVIPATADNLVTASNQLVLNTM